MIRLLLNGGKPKQKETVEQNARRFVQMVTTLAKDNRYIHCFPHAGFRGVKREEYGWECMVNPLWRALVMELLARAPVADAHFAPPDTMDGWTFSARSTVPIPRIAQLELEDVI